MAIRRTIAIDRLLQWWDRAVGNNKAGVIRCGPLVASIPRHEPAGNEYRQLSRLAVADRFLLLADVISSEVRRRFTLALQSPRRWLTADRGWTTRHRSGPIFLTPLGDYAASTDGPVAVLSDRWLQGRFLVLLSRQPVSARVLNGWAIEVRSQGLIYHLLHSNRGRRLRPLGPHDAIQTDARLALMQWPESSPQRFSLWAEDACKMQYQKEIVLTASAPCQIAWTRPEGDA